FFDSFRVVAPRNLARIARFLQPLESNAFHNASITEVEAGNDALGEHETTLSTTDDTDHAEEQTCQANPCIFSVSSASCVVESYVAPRKFRRICSPASPDFSGWN